MKLYVREDDDFGFDLTDYLPKGTARIVAYNRVKVGDLIIAIVDVEIFGAFSYIALVDDLEEKSNEILHYVIYDKE